MEGTPISFPCMLGRGDRPVDHSGRVRFEGFAWREEISCEGAAGRKDPAMLGAS